LIFTIGHSTRPIEEFHNLLVAHKVQVLFDVRTIPGSRRNPQYNEHELSSFLRDNNIEYLHLKGLGGLRKPLKDSINTGWRNQSFRGYADYMQTAQFEENLSKLIKASNQKRVAIMCAEAVPWRCHRSLIADALVARNMDVEHIITDKDTRPHKLTSFAKIDGFQLTYPEELVL
jgi:uncharacterized protein (DUF488 family)